jgi:glycosyltransferase involved in cell wall biosynthesis
MKKLKILQVGTIGNPVLKGSGAGGAEKVISYLDQEFVRQGHDSFVAAPGNSTVYGSLVPTLNLNFVGSDDAWAYEEHYKKVVDFILKHKLDIVHDNPGRGLVNSKAYRDNKHKINVPILITNHGSFLPGNEEERSNLINSINSGGVYLNALSSAHKQSLESQGAQVVDFIYHGVPLDLFEYTPWASDILFSLGRICKEKGQHLAIDVARKTGRRLIIGGGIEDNRYFLEKIQPHLNDRILYIGLLNDKEKSKVYSNSSAFLMPITWPEPFGLVMIESMAVGTPVIAFNYGSVPEIVENGETGWVIDSSLHNNSSEDLEEMTNKMAERVLSLDNIKRKKCRLRVKELFTIKSETENYLKLYKKLI